MTLYTDSVYLILILIRPISSLDLASEQLSFSVSVGSNILAVPNGSTFSHWPASDILTTQCPSQPSFLLMHPVGTPSQQCPPHPLRQQCLTHSLPPPSTQWGQLSHCSLLSEAVGGLKARQGGRMGRDSNRLNSLGGESNVLNENHCSHFERIIISAKWCGPRWLVTRHARHQTV